MSVPGISAEIAQCCIRRVRLQIEKSEKINANLSTMVRFITKYMARVGRLRGFFYKKNDWYKVHCYYRNSYRHGMEYSEPGDALGCYHGLLFFSLHAFSSLFLSAACLPFRRIRKKFKLRTWTIKKVDVSSAKIANGDTLGRWSTVPVVGQTV